MGLLTFAPCCCRDSFFLSCECANMERLSSTPCGSPVAFFTWRQHAASETCSHVSALPDKSDRDRKERPMMLPRMLTISGPGGRGHGRGQAFSLARFSDPKGVGGFLQSFRAPCSGAMAPRGASQGATEGSADRRAPQQSPQGNKENPQGQNQCLREQTSRKTIIIRQKAFFFA